MFLGHLDMGISSKKIFTDTTAVERAFYEAIGRRDLSAFMETWADEDDILCVFPSGDCWQGYQQIERAWANVLHHQSPAHQFNVQVRLRNDGVMMAVHHVIEEITILKQPQSEKAVTSAINVFLRTPDGWRMFIHQATGIRTQQQNAPSEDAATHWTMIPAPSKSIH